MFNLSFSNKIILLGIATVLLTTLTLLAMTAWQSSQYDAIAQDRVNEVVNNNLRNVVQGIYNMVKAQGEATQQQVDYNLKVAQYVLANTGQVSLSASETVTWTAVNQLTQESVTVRLPKLLIGGNWLGNNTDPNIETNVVDPIARMTGGAVTIFQRMNPQGDMIRVATNVQTTDGRRAIGTYIPAVNPNGTANSVIAVILNNEAYHGIAFVVNAWYIAAYAPLRDSAGNLIGMLFVGVKQNDIQSLRQIILQTRIGKTGHVYVVGGRGDERGYYAISPGGQHEGESAWQLQDMAGNYIIQMIVTKALSLREGEIAQWQYLWREPGESTPYQKIVLFTYYAPWDWVIVAEVREDELLGYQQVLQVGQRRMLTTSVIMGLGIALFIGIVGFLTARSFTRPLQRLTDTAIRIASGDLRLATSVDQKDEIGILARAFNTMVTQLAQRLNAEREQRQHLQTTVQQYRDYLEVVGKGNLSVRLPITDQPGAVDDPLVALGRGLNEATASLQKMIAQTQEAATALSLAAAEILAATNQQATGASEQSAAILQTTATVEEVKTIVEQASQRAQEVAATAQHTREVSQAGQRAVQDTIASMNQIKERVESLAEIILALSARTQQIGEIITTVNNLASQSNILALNAAIEAERAGEHGKGFAVVAAEVRSLAAQSRQATAQVKAILTEIQQATNTAVMATEEGTKGVDRGVQLAAQTQQAIGQLSAVIEESAQAAAQMVAGGRQQVIGMDQIVLAMQNINQVTVQSLNSTRQAEKAARDLNELARRLSQTIAQYQI